MTPDQIRLVQESFRLVLPIREQAAALFYGKLFELDPGTRRLFAATDLKSQGTKLMAAIGMVVGALNAPDAMLGKVKEMARRHVGYGVEEAHYATVGAALVWTLETGLGDAFTADLRAAWIAAYTLLSTTMIEAAREVHARAGRVGQESGGRYASSDLRPVTPALSSLVFWDRPRLLERRFQHDLDLGCLLVVLLHGIHARCQPLP